MTDQSSDQAAQARAQEAQKADKERQENAKKVVAEQRQAREAAAKEAPEAGKPTPTQEENDLAAMGVHVPEHEPDGSPEQDQSFPPKQTKQSEAKRPAPGGYQTRQSRPAEPTS